MSLSLFIARRLYATKNHSEGYPSPLGGGWEGASSLGVNIATAGVAIGLAIMIVSVAVVLGFKDEIKSKVVGFGSHIQILNSDAMQQADTLPVIPEQAFIDRIKTCRGVARVQRVTQKSGIIKTETDFQGLVFNGIGSDYDTAFIARHMVEGTLPDYSCDTTRNDIVVSKTIADALKVKCGEKVFAYFFDNEIKTRRYTVKGIYQTNLMQFDGTYVFANIASINRINQWADTVCSKIEVIVDDFSLSEQIADSIAAVKPSSPDANGCYYSVYTIRELYGAIFDWLKLLDLNIWVILGLMICVCCFTMISGLLILILEKTSTIGVLKAVGARNSTVRHIFLHYGVFIIGRGLALGNIIGLALCYIQWQWHPIPLDAASYYVAYVPISFNWLFILSLNVVTLLICALILIAPTFIVSRIHPVKALKFD